MATPEDVPSALRAFLEVQASRAKLYARFQDGFHTFLKTKQQNQYRSLMAELTTSFNNCSKTVIAMEAVLTELGRPDLAAELRQVQESERDKLRLTLALQALKQAAAFSTFSWQKPSTQPNQQQGGGGSGSGAGVTGHDPDDDEALALLDPVYAASLGAHAHGCQGHGHGCGHGGHVHGHGDGRVHDQDREQGQEPPDQQLRAVANGLRGLGTGGPLVGGSVSSGLMNGSGATAATPVPASAADGTTLAVEKAESCNAAAEGLSLDGVQDANLRRTDHASDGCVPAPSGAVAGQAAVDAPAPSEPTRREYESAVKEALQGLDTCIRKINEAIENIQIELEDG